MSTIVKRISLIITVPSLLVFAGMAAAQDRHRPRRQLRRTPRCPGPISRTGASRLTGLSGTRDRRAKERAKGYE
jgi:hypothetical protein